MADRQNRRSGRRTNDDNNTSPDGEVIHDENIPLIENLQVEEQQHHEQQQEEDGVIRDEAGDIDEERGDVNAEVKAEDFMVGDDTLDVNQNTNDASMPHGELESEAEEDLRGLLLPGTRGRFGGQADGTRRATTSNVLRSGNAILRNNDYVQSLIQEASSASARVDRSQTYHQPVPNPILQSQDSMLRENLQLMKLFKDINPKYNGHNYEVWHKQVIQGWANQLFLRKTIYGEDQEEPTDLAAHEKWLQRQGNASMFMRYALDDKMNARYFRSGRDAASVFDAILKDHVQKTSCSRNFHREELMNFDQGTKPLDQWMDEIEEKQDFLVTQMDAGLSEGDLIYILRRNCHSQFRDVIQQVTTDYDTQERKLVRCLMKTGMTLGKAQQKAKEENDIDFVTIKEDVKALVRDMYFAKQKNNIRSDKLTAFLGFNVVEEDSVSKKKKKHTTTTRNCYVCNSPNHTMSNCPEKKDKGCYRCGGFHKLINCPQRKNRSPSGEDQKEHTSENNTIICTIISEEAATNYCGYAIGNLTSDDIQNDDGIVKKAFVNPVSDYSLSPLRQRYGDLIISSRRVFSQSHLNNNVTSATNICTDDGNSGDSSGSVSTTNNGDFDDRCNSVSTTNKCTNTICRW